MWTSTVCLEKCRTMVGFVEGAIVGGLMLLVFAAGFGMTWGLQSPTRFEKMEGSGED